MYELKTADRNKINFVEINKNLKMRKDEKS